jgi:anti-anti-sigma regulatory factor
MNPPLVSSISAGFFRQLVWIRIECKGSVDCSNDLRRFIELMIRQGRTKMVIDLNHCPSMDSTFMGTLAGLALRLRKVQDGSLDILNPSERNLQSLRELGLDRILSVDCSGSLWVRERELMHDAAVEPVEPAPADEKALHETMTEAHEALCQANSENIPRFRDVLELLRESQPE